MTPPSGRDNIYANPRDIIERFAFDEAVAEVFPDMIQRSVPGYAHIIEMTGIFAGRYALPDSNIYDLGCSLGAATLSMGHFLQGQPVKLLAIDNSAAMIKRCRELLAKSSSDLHPKIIQDDIRNIKIENASVVVLNFTLQFLPPLERPRLIENIFRGLLPGGVLLLAEKIAFEHQQVNQQMIDLHHEFKKLNGYSDLEISQKRSALENVLIPETIVGHLDRLRKAGFGSAHPWFRSLNFAAFLAIKTPAGESTI